MVGVVPITMALGQPVDAFRLNWVLITAVAVLIVFKTAPGIAQALYLAIALTNALLGKVACSRVNSEAEIPKLVDHVAVLEGLRIP
jgi:hypothetical protein